MAALKWQCGRALSLSLSTERRIKKRETAIVPSPFPSYSSVTGKILRNPLCLSLHLHLRISFRLSARYWLSYRLKYFTDKYISPIHIHQSVNTHSTSAVFLILISRDSAVEFFNSCIIQAIAQSIANRPSVKVSNDQEYSQDDDQGGLCPSRRFR